MKDKTNPVEESNKLLQQLNLVLVGGDYNGNTSNSSLGGSGGSGGEFAHLLVTGEKIPIDNLNANSNGGANNNNNNNNSNDSTQEPQHQTADGYRKDSGDNLSYDEEFNDPAKIIGRVGEEHMRNVLFFLGFVAKFLQLVVASALLILAIEWLPLHSFIVDQVDNMFISFLILGFLCAALLLIKFRGRFLVVLLVNMLFMINFFWYMAASSFDFLVFSPYWIVLCAVTQTATCLFLSILVYFQKATYRGCGIYGYALLVPIVFFVLSQPYYFWWYVKLTEEQDIRVSIGTITVADLESSVELSTTTPQEEYTTTTAVAAEFEQESDATKREMIMSYPYYMINVCSGIGLAAVMTFEMVAWSQYSVKGLKFKAGTGILSGSFTALADGDDTAPVNL